MVSHLGRVIYKAESAFTIFHYAIPIIYDDVLGSSPGVGKGIEGVLVS